MTRKINKLVFFFIPSFFGKIGFGLVKLIFKAFQQDQCEGALVPSDPEGSLILPPFYGTPNIIHRDLKVNEKNKIFNYKLVI
jgi:hypothetical protein